MKEKDKIQIKIWALLGKLNTMYAIEVDNNNMRLTFANSDVCYNYRLSQCDRGACVGLKSCSVFYFKGR